VELTALGLLPAEFRAQHDLLTRLLVAARLLAPNCQTPPERARQVLADACGARDFDGLLLAVDEARHGVAEIWAETFGVELEDRI